MKKINILFIAVLLVFLNGCAELGDYSYDVGTDYQVFRPSAHQIRVSPKNDGYTENNSIPPKVVEVAWNERYVIAKQQGLKNQNLNEGDTYEEPDTSKIYYWILDTIEKQNYGPYNLEEFNAKLEKFNLTELKLKSVESYRTNAS